MTGIRRIVLLIYWIILLSCNGDDPAPGGFSLTSAFAGTQQLQPGVVTIDVAVDQSIALNFTKSVDRSTIGALNLIQGTTIVASTFSYSSQDRTVVIFPNAILASSTEYSISISSGLKATDGATFEEVILRFKTLTSALSVATLTIGGVNALPVTGIVDDVPLNASIVLSFSSALDPATATANNITLKQDGVSVGNSISVSGNQLTVLPNAPLKHLRRFQIQITDNLAGINGETFEGIQREFYTTENVEPVLPLLANDEDTDTDNSNDLLSVVQLQTFKYFWDFAHPVSGMARERNTSGDVVTSGGSGFGIMALIVGMERQFITRAEGLSRMEKIVTFLEDADRFHGAWSHWINGATGEAVPFSAKDNGGDLVETSFLVQGLITFRQYLSSAVPAEAALGNRITALWETVEWDWYRKQNEEVLYWHWSPDFTWDMNFPLYGYFEEQITYVLAASSPTHPIPQSVYTNGYGMNGQIVKNQTFYNYQLPLGTPAPLFWVHYSYLGLNPRFSDSYANYWDQNVSATRINHAYCADNPKQYVGYSDHCWGLTSSDNSGGYDAHSPANDKGVITPTAALSSFPYTPEESMKALKFFYYSLGDRLWGEYGFYDAFNLTEQWTASSYLAIDQGPIIVMIENYRTGLLWDLFMSAPEVQTGISTLEFVY
jgi:hypothetical protein